MSFLTNANTMMNIVYLAIMLVTVAGSVVAFKVGIARTATEVQERVINALKSEIETMKDRISDLERENGQLRLKLTVVTKALRRRNMFISIEGELISMHDLREEKAEPAHITGA